MIDEDPFDYEEQDVSELIRPSIVGMVDDIQWMDQVQDKQQKDLDREIRVQKGRTAQGEGSLAERCLICTLAMGTCEHTRAWTLRHQEEVFLAQKQLEKDEILSLRNNLQSEIDDALDRDVLGPENNNDGNENSPITGTDEIALEQMAWIPLEERAVDKLNADAAKLSSPNDRVWHSSVLLDRFIVVFGGLKTKEGQNPLLTTELIYLNDIKAYDLSSQAWKTLKLSTNPPDSSVEEGGQSPKGIISAIIAVPPPRYGHGAAAITKDSFIIFGGRGERGKIFSDTWLFDLRTCRWTHLDPILQETSFATPPARFFTACCADRDVTPTAEAEDAGEEAEVTEDCVSRYKRIYNLFNRSRRTIYLFGGTNGADNFNDLWRFRLHYVEEPILPKESHRNLPNRSIPETAVPQSISSNADGQEQGTYTSPPEEEEYDFDEIEANVRLDEEITAEMRLTGMLKRLDAGPYSSFSKSIDQQGSHTNHKRKYRLRIEGRWERCVATGNTPCPRYGHSLSLLVRPVQPPGLPTSLTALSRVSGGGVDASAAAEERFILVLGGCHVSPEAEISIGSEASAQETAGLLSLATRLQRSYAQENLSSVLSASQLRQQLLQDLRASTKSGDLQTDTAEALSHWLREAGNVATLLSLRERDTRQAEQCLVDAVKLHRATQQWKLTGKNMAHAARHSESHLDIHWLRLPPPPPSYPSSCIRSSLSSPLVIGSRMELDAVAMEGGVDDEVGEILQWEVSQHGASMGLNGGGKFRPSARMHFGASVLRHQREARFLLVLGGIEPTSLTFLSPTAASASSNPPHSLTARSSPAAERMEMQIFALDLRTMVWTNPTAVNSRQYKQQTLAVAKAEYLRAQAHCQSLESTAVALLGRTKHLSTAATHALRQQLGLDDILEVRQSRVFRDVCRWRLETLKQSYGPSGRNVASAAVSLGIDYSSLVTSSDTNFGFVPGKRIVSLLDTKKSSHKSHSALSQTSDTTFASKPAVTAGLDDATASYAQDQFAYDGFWEGTGGFALTRLGQRLILVGGSLLSPVSQPNHSRNSGNTALLTSDHHQNLVGTRGTDGLGIVNVSQQRVQRALHPPNVVVLDMEALSVKQTRWRRNYYASLELYRKQEEGRLQMEALVSLHALREAQRLETETRLRETRQMSYEDYLSHIPPLSKPAPVHLDQQRASAHSIWVAWDDLLEVAAVTLRRLRYNRSHLMGRYVHQARSMSMVMDPATATGLLRRFHTQQQRQQQHQTVRAHSPPLQTLETGRKTGTIASKIKQNNNCAVGARSSSNQTERSLESHASEASILTLLATMSERKANSQPHQQQQESSNEVPPFITYFLYAHIGFETLLPGDIVDVLPKEVKRPLISTRPVCGDPSQLSISGSTTDRSDDAPSQTQRALTDYHQIAFEDCDLFFDDTSPRFRGVILKASVFSSKPSYFTVKYTDKSLETLVSRHRIRRVFRPSSREQNLLHQQQLSASSQQKEEFSVDKEEEIEENVDKINWQLHLNLQSLSSASRNNTPFTNNTEVVPTVVPDPKIWTLVYAGHDTHYAVTNLLPRYVLDTEPELKIGVLFAIQSHGMDTPDYERSQLSHPVLLHTVPAASNTLPLTPSQALAPMTQACVAETDAAALSSSNSVTSALSQSSAVVAIAAPPQALVVATASDANPNNNSNSMSRTKKQVVSAVIQARHLTPPTMLPVTIQDHDDPAGLYKTRRIAKIETPPAPTEVVLSIHDMPRILKTDAVPALLDERAETSHIATVKIARQDNYVWAEGQGDHYA